MTAPLTLDRAHVLAFRRRVGALDRRLPAGAESLRTAAWAGLQDSAPRAALVSLHARVEGIGPQAWEDPVFVQVWGPRACVFVVAAVDRALLTLGIRPDDPAQRARGEELVDRLEAARRRGGAVGPPGDDAIAGLALRQTGPTGRVLIRWDGARRPDLQFVERPDADPGAARLELARRFLHVAGPATAGGFAWWAGLSAAVGRAAFARLRPELTAVRTPIGDAWALASDEPLLVAASRPSRAVDGAPARLLSAGDPYLMVGDRELLLPEAAQRAAVFPRGTVWPGAVMVRGELVGTWRRSRATVRVQPWRRLTDAERAAVEAEAAGLPIPDPGGCLSVDWKG